MYRTLVSMETFLTNTPPPPPQANHTITCTAHARIHVQHMLCAVCSVQASLHYNHGQPQYIHVCAVVHVAMATNRLLYYMYVLGTYMYMYSLYLQCIPRPNVRLENVHVHCTCTFCTCKNPYIYLHVHVQCTMYNVHVHVAH